MSPMTESAENVDGPTHPSDSHVEETPDEANRRKFREALGQPGIPGDVRVATGAVKDDRSTPHFTDPR